MPFAFTACGKPRRPFPWTGIKLRMPLARSLVPRTAARWPSAPLTLQLRPVICARDDVDAIAPPPRQAYANKPVIGLVAEAVPHSENEPASFDWKRFQ